jgi:predicted HTH transcriptional regulator
MTESNRIEYKRELTDSLEREVVAFLNYRDGGIIYLGVDDHGKAVGLANPDDLQLKIKDRLKNNIQPSIMGLFDIVREEKNGVHVLKIIVAGGLEKPYFLKKYGMTEKGCFLRVGSACEPMPQEMIDSLYSSRVRNTIGRMESTRLGLTFEQLKIYYQERGLALNSAFMKNLELLTPGGKPNYAAYLLADENGASIQIAKYADTTRVNLMENLDFGRCSLVKAYKNIMDRMNVENTVYTKIGVPLREERPMINPVALREAVVNAIVHNDYSNGSVPKFEFFSDRLEITSAGGLPYGLELDDFFAGHSAPRNKEIMRVFRDLEIVEHLGSGIPRILDAYGPNAFNISRTFMRLIFPYTEPIQPQHDTAGQDATPQIGTKSGPSRDQVEVMRKCFVESAIGDLMNVAGRSNRTKFRDQVLNPLLDTGWVEMTIPDKPRSSKQKYRLTEKGHSALSREGT